MSRPCFVSAPPTKRRQAGSTSAQLSNCRSQCSANGLLTALALHSTGARRGARSRRTPRGLPAYPDWTDRRRGREARSCARGRDPTSSSARTGLQHHSPARWHAAERLPRDAAHAYLGDAGKTLAGTDIVDDFPHPQVQGFVLQAELFDKATVVDQEVSRDRAAASLRLEADIGIGQEFSYDSCQFTHAERGPAGIVGRMLRLVREQHAGECLRHVLDVND